MKKDEVIRRLEESKINSPCNVGNIQENQRIFNDAIQHAIFLARQLEEPEVLVEMDLTVTHQKYSDSSHIYLMDSDGVDYFDVSDRFEFDTALLKKLLPHIGESVRLLIVAREGK